MSSDVTGPGDTPPGPGPDADGPDPDPGAAPPSGVTPADPSVFDVSVLDTSGTSVPDGSGSSGVSVAGGTSVAGVGGLDIDPVEVALPDVTAPPATGGIALGARAAGRAVAVLDRPSRTDPIVRQASNVVGGPAGRRMALGRARFGPGGGLLWITMVLTLLAGLTLGLALVEKQHCRNEGWNSPDQFWHACYSDIPVLYGSAGLGRHDAPSLVSVLGPGGLGQPPLAGAAMWVMSRAVGGGEGAGPARTFFDASAVLLAAALAVAVAAIAAASRRRPWDAAHVALSPVLVTGGLISYDLLAVAFLSLALLAWSRRQPLLGGLLLGLGIATRPVVSVVILAVLVLAVRTGRSRPFLLFALPAVLAWLAVRLVLIQGWSAGLPDALKTWRASGAGYGSLWLVPHLVAQSQPDKLKVWGVLEHVWYRGSGLGPTTTTMCMVVALVLVGLATVFLGLAVVDRPRLAHLALFAVGGTLLVTKSVPVQAGLVLLPLIALAGLRWRDHLIWATTELVYFVGVWLYIAAGSDPNKGLPATVYMIMMLARDGGILWIMTRAVKAMRDPLADPVRVPVDGSAGVDDPHGGGFEGSPDALVIRLV